MPLRSSALRWALACAACAGALLAVRGSALREPHYWDALGCYVYQARFIATHGLDLGAYPQLGFLRPPLFIGLLAVAMKTFGDTREQLHAVTLLIAALLPPATFAVTRRLGGSAAAAWLSALLCAASPMFLAQAGLVQSDVPATVLTTLAWLLLLAGHARWFALCASAAVLTKESAYFLCLPAAYLLWERAGRPQISWRHARSGLRLWRLWPAAAPGAVLVLWQLSQRFIVGHTFSPAYAGYIGPGNALSALSHSFLEGGRFLLVPWALLALSAHLRGEDAGAAGSAGSGRAATSERSAEVRATALACVALPVFFCAPLPRYMLPSLPLLCALGALGMLRLPGRRRPIVAGALTIGLLLAGVRGLWDYPDVAHLEASLLYREQVALHREAAQLLRGAGARRVAAAFPMSAVISAPPQDGFLEAPLPVLVPTEQTPAEALCTADFLVQAQDSVAVHGLRRLEERGAATLWRQLGPAAPPPEAPLDGERDRAVRIYRVDCGRARPD